MSEKPSSKSSPFNVTSVIALLTVLGGLLLVSKKLSSDRPKSSAEAVFNNLGDQTVRARLWEDPLKRDRETLTNGFPQLKALQSQLSFRNASTNPEIMLLAVMLKGGPYSEDKESRIRSRYAVVSALGESGYAPETSDHVGALRFSWPTTADLHEGWLKDPNSSLEIDESTNAPYALKATGQMYASYEWYRHRKFHAGASAQSNSPPSVLLLWLDEDSFSDEPVVRLGLLFNRLRDVNGYILFKQRALIGPRTSSVLQSMLPPYDSNAPPLNFCTELRAKTKVVFRQIDLYSATPSAMDEALVSGKTNSRPREAIQFVLTNTVGFKSFHNFCATDSQLAAEALKELKGRNIDLTKTNNHNLVLISEWDSFYGRVMSITYAAELACLQKTMASPSRQEFVDQYRSGKKIWPINLHPFVYLQGLDGQTTGNQTSENTPSDPESKSSKIGSIQDLARWVPDENKAVGEAQLDYLARLAGRIAKLQKQLQQHDRGKIDAIGIVGSDVYDTLLILQALRPRFPEAVFFTTDLDARFWYPRELEWSRNLVVLSGYGLELHPDLQGSIAPFRDSSQSAQFAAALCALGKPDLQQVLEIPPRRFEVGRAGAYDFSVTAGAPLHPLPLALAGFPLFPTKLVVGIMLVIFFGGLFASLLWRPLRRLTWDSRQTEIEPLWFREEDLGGAAGAEELLLTLKASTDSFAVWFWEELLKYLSVTMGEVPAINQIGLQSVLDFLNRKILQDSIPTEVIINSTAIKDETKKQLSQLDLEKSNQGAFLTRNSIRRLRLHREVSDELFQGLAIEAAKTKTEPKGAFNTFEAARDSRKAGLELYRLSRNQRRLFWFGVPVLIAYLGLLVGSALWDTFKNVVGEPLTLTRGISIWPTELLRWAACVLALYFVCKSYRSVRSGALRLLREYRLPFNCSQDRCRIKFTLNSVPVPQAGIEARQLWIAYQQLGQLKHRICRTIFPFVVYFLFAIGIFVIGRAPYVPGRGQWAKALDLITLSMSITTFLFLTFWIMDAVRLCRWLIEQFSEAHTIYPHASLTHFGKQRGLEAEPGVLEEWIDLKLIADLTEHVSRLIYYPFIVFFVSIVARHHFWDRWSWPPGLIIIFSLNLLLIVGSVIVLQSSARKAREIGLSRLKLKEITLQRSKVATNDQHKANVVEKLVEDIESLRKGAFVSFWDNPLVGAILVPSGGVALLEVLIYLLR